MNYLVPVEISNRHIHLSQEDLYTLFGEGYKLNHHIKELSQPGNWAEEETLTIVGPKGQIPNVRILGPIRKQTQVEITKTDSFFLGVKPPVRLSGELEGTPGITVVGPKGKIELNTGLIIAKRHIHMNPVDAKKFKVKDYDVVQVRTIGERGLIFDNVIIRVHESFQLMLHLDTDEANSAEIKNGDVTEFLMVRQLKLA